MAGKNKINKGAQKQVEMKKKADQHIAEIAKEIHAKNPGLFYNYPSLVFAAVVNKKLTKFGIKLKTISVLGKLQRNKFYAK